MEEVQLVLSVLGQWAAWGHSCPLPRESEIRPRDSQRGKQDIWKKPKK